MRLAHLFDHLVGTGEQIVGYANSLRPGCRDVDDELEFDACTTGRSAGFAPLRIRPV